MGPHVTDTGVSERPSRPDREPPSRTGPPVALSPTSHGPLTSHTSTLVVKGREMTGFHPPSTGSHWTLRSYTSFPPLHSFYSLTVLSGRYSRALAGGRIEGRRPPLAVYALCKTTVLPNQQVIAIQNGIIPKDCIATLFFHHLTAKSGRSRLVSYFLY